MGSPEQALISTAVKMMKMILSLLSLVALPLPTNGQFFGIETGYNNTCLWENNGLNRDGPREFDCPRFVIESTDQIWNMYRDPEVIKYYLRKYMVEDWESISPMGEYLRGYDKLEPLVLDTIKAFPSSSYTSWTRSARGTTSTGTRPRCR